ncbi:MAG: hypothetical protein WAZ34_03975 [Rhodocyclaceae bacterium]
MSAESQIEIPQSFIALFCAPGRFRPNAAQEVVESRYALCEDMACLLTEHAQSMAFDQGIGESEVLQRCRQGLLADDAVFAENEAHWVIHRLAELLGWAQLESEKPDG